MTRTLSVVLSITTLFIVFLTASGCGKSEQPKQEAQAPVASAGPSVTEFTFENDIKGWGNIGQKDIKLDESNAVKHGGSSSLKISGKSSAEKWNYAASRKINLEPGKKYRLSGWMFVESISDPKAPPFLKCAIEQQAKPPKFITNVNTKKYDLAKKGEWQELSAVFTAPSESGVYGYIAIEKGKKAVIDVTLYIDDIKVEPVQ